MPEEQSEQTEQTEKKDFNCTVTIAESGPWKKKISVEIPRDQIEKELDQQFGDLGKSAEVPGFRKGHAPRVLIEKRYGEEITKQAKLRVLAQAFEKIEEENKFDILGEPDLDPEKIELPEEGDLKFDYEIEVRPEFDLPSLEGIKVEKALIEVTDERIQDAVDELCRRNGKMDDVKQAAKEDLIVADATMKVEGIEQPEEAADVNLRVGPTAIMGVWVEDAEKALDKAKVDSTVTCSAVIQDTHPREEFREKKAEFTLKVKSIYRLIPAALNEEFLARLGVEDEESLRRIIQENLEEQVDRESRKDMARQIYDYLHKEIEFDLPAGVAARYTERLVTRHYYDLLQKGVSQDKIQENIDKIKTSSSQQAMRELKTSFIMERVANDLEIEVSDMELNGYIAQIAASQNRRPEKLRDELHASGRIDMIRSEIREEKAIGKILEMAQVVDAAPARKKKTEKKTPVRKGPKAQASESGEEEKTTKKEKKTKKNDVDSKEKDA